MMHAIFFSMPTSCRCSAPKNPSSDTLDYWNNMGINSSAVVWANLTVSVSLI